MDKIRADYHLKNVELNTAVDESLIRGASYSRSATSFIDASIAFDLNNIKKQFQNNDFIYKI